MCLDPRYQTPFQSPQRWYTRWCSIQGSVQWYCGVLRFGHYNVINQRLIIFWTRMLLLSVSFDLDYFSTCQYYNKRTLTKQILLVALVSLSWITWWKMSLCLTGMSASRWSIYCSGIFCQHLIIFWTRMLLLLVSFDLDYFSTCQYYNKRTLTEQISLVLLVSLSWIP